MKSSGHRSLNRQNGGIGFGPRPTCRSRLDTAKFADRPIMRGIVPLLRRSPAFAPECSHMFADCIFNFAHFKKNFNTGARPWGVTRAEVHSLGERLCPLRRSAIYAVRVRVHVLEGGGYGARESPCGARSRFGERVAARTVRPGPAGAPNITASP